MWWFQQGVCLLPVGLVVWSSATFIVSFAVSVLLGHVDILVPYISDTSTEPPERCVFGVMLNISSFLGMATIYVRYKQVQALVTGEDRRLHRLNFAGLVLGLLSSFGMCIIANFQKTTVISVHLLGAGLTFGTGALYILVQTGMSYHMQPRFHGRDVLWARTAVGLWALLSIIIVFIASVIMYDEVPDLDVAMKMHWNPEEKGYMAHLVSAAAEWSLALSFISFFFTYIRDFQKINLRVDAVLKSDHLYHNGYYDVSIHVHHGERSPLLAGSI